jgi:hypothetical protein
MGIKDYNVIHGAYLGGEFGSCMIVQVYKIA